MIDGLTGGIKELKVSLNVLKDVLECDSTKDQRKGSLIVFEHITQHILQIEKEAQNLKLAIEVRDETITHLGEKLSNLRMQKSEPFYVKCQKRSPSVTRSKSLFRQADKEESTKTDDDSPKRSPSISRRKSLFRHADKEEWTKNDADSHMKELSDQIARLSLLPMGLSPEDLEEQIADVSATRLYEAKALNLIKVGKQRGLSDKKVKAFLQKKGLPDVTIARCFDQAEKQFPKSTRSSVSTESDSEEDTSEYIFSRPKQGL